VSTRWRTVEADAGTVRVEEYGTDAFRVYRAPRLAGDDAIGSFVVEGAEHGVPVWIWWAGDDEDSDQGGATSENEAIAAILSYTASRGESQS
jgi:hypothetical protein